MRMSVLYYEDIYQIIFNWASYLWGAYPHEKLSKYLIPFIIDSFFDVELIKEMEADDQKT